MRELLRLSGADEACALTLLTPATAARYARLAVACEAREVTDVMMEPLLAVIFPPIAEHGLSVLKPSVVRDFRRALTTALADLRSAPADPTGGGARAAGQHGQQGET